MTLTTPVMLYDGDCGFCMRWIRWWERLTYGKVSYRSYQEAGREYPQVTDEKCKESVQLIMPGGRVFSGAHAVFKTLELSGKYKFFHFFYDHLPLFGRISEWAYQWVAHHRMLLSSFTTSPKKCKLR